MGSSGIFTALYPLGLDPPGGTMSGPRGQGLHVPRRQVNQRTTPPKAKTSLRRKQRTHSFLKIHPFYIRSGLTGGGQPGEPAAARAGAGGGRPEGFPITRRLCCSLPKNEHFLKLH